MGKFIVLVLPFAPGDARRKPVGCGIQQGANVCLAPVARMEMWTQGCCRGWRCFAARSCQLLSPTLKAKMISPPPSSLVQEKPL